MADPVLAAIAAQKADLEQQVADLLKANASLNALKNDLIKRVQLLERAAWACAASAESSRLHEGGALYAPGCNCEACALYEEACDFEPPVPALPAASGTEVVDRG